MKVNFSLYTLAEKILKHCSNHNIPQIAVGVNTKSLVWFFSHSGKDTFS